MDEGTLRGSIELYENQLAQVNAALQASGGDNPDLLELKTNLEEVISLSNESLLSLKKAEALKKVDSNPELYTNDDEYAAFEKAVAESQSENGVSTSTIASTEYTGSVQSHDLQDIIGTCVRAPFSHDWGGFQYHNAAIIDLDTDNQKVRVMYSHPTHSSMKICPFYLESRCKFSDDECELSHGEMIHIDDLREYEPMDSSCLSVGDVCMAKFYHDDVWYKATIVDVFEDDTVQVMYNDYGEAVHTVDRSALIPIDSQSESTDSSSDGVSDNETDLVGDLQLATAIDEEVPNYLWKPSENEKLADWELHTRGLGSKLMAAMGYQLGQGLGKDGQGRVEPVPILKLPPGKSLDRIMQLKERTGDKDMFDVLKKEKRKKKKLAAALRPPRNNDVFSYLNKSLGHGMKVDLTPYRKAERKSKTKQAAGPSVISKHELRKKSDVNLNIQMMKTDEEMRKVEQEILSIKRRLEINISRKDAGGIAHLQSKLSKAEKYLETLKGSQKELKRHRGQRDDRKKLMNF